MPDAPSVSRERSLRVAQWTQHNLPEVLADESGGRKRIPSANFWWRGNRIEPLLPEPVPLVLSALTEEFGGELGEHLVDFLCYPAFECEAGGDYKVYGLRADMVTVALHYVRGHRSVYIDQTLLARFKGLLTRSWPLEYEGQQPTFFSSSHPRGEEGYHYPGIGTLGLLLAEVLDPTDHWKDFKSFLYAEWNREFKSEYSYRGMMFTYKLGDIYLKKLVQRCVAVAMGREGFTYEDFKRLAGITHEMVYYAEPGKESESTSLTEVQAMLCEFGERHAWELYAHYDPAREDALDAADSAFETATAMLRRYAQSGFAGTRWLVKTCEHIERFGLTNKHVSDQPHWGSGHVLTDFAIVHGYGPGESEDELVKQLKAFKAKALWLVFPFAGPAQRTILKALNAIQLKGLHEFLAQFVNSTPYTAHPEVEDFTNSTNEDSGVLDLHRFTAVIEGVAPALIKEYFKAMKGAKLGYERGVYFCEAALGWNRDHVSKYLKTHGQASLKALGLLPLENDDEARDRYVMLRRAWKECSKYGAERQANTRAAVNVGLKNLAARASYRDVARMEWDLESQIGGEAEAALGERQLSDWTVRVEIEGLKPKLRVAKGGKTLKSVPAGLRKLPEYKSLREQMSTLEEQARRFRGALERMMCDGECIAVEELEKLSAIAAVRFLLSNLIGIDAAGHLGLIDAGESCLVDGTQSIPIEGHLRIAHVSDLFENDCLSKWQRAIVAASIVQPFKQAYRELYLLTPAERDSSPLTNRYSGRTIDTAVAYRLLQSRGWLFGGGEDEAQCWKDCGSGIIADWSFPHVHHFFSEDPTQISDAMLFRRGRDELPLDQVPAVMFSEVMRDADLVVSVAIDKEADDAFWSTEITGSRATVIQAVTGKLGLNGVSFEDRFVWVKGKRADYRIHLGSGNIHIMPGSYLCIVPDADKNAGPIYLPFADKDRKTTEIISKVFFLLDDDQITDPGINSQIDRHQRSN